MNQLKNLADDRLIDGCIYCGGPADTRDHVPARIFLDTPFPDNLPVVGACRECNNGFSRDEEYFACLIEAVIAGSTDPGLIRRASVAKILRRSLALRARIEAAKTTVKGQTQFSVEPARIRNVLLKLAKGHAAYELSQPCRKEPSHVWWGPIGLLSERQRDDFNAVHLVNLLGEIGSRGIQRMLLAQIMPRQNKGSRPSLGLVINNWVDVQEDRYRFHAIDDNSEVIIKIVIAEYLACEVIWHH